MNQISQSESSEVSLLNSTSPELGAARHVAAKRCLLCGGGRHLTIFVEFGVDILECQQCGHVFSSFPAAQHNDGFWGEHVEKTDHFYWSKARGRMHRDFFRKFMDGRSGRLLDMGCGLGYFVNAAGQLPKWQAFGCEISPAAVQYARETLGLRNVCCGRLEKADFPGHSFDIITMWDVLEHVPDPDPLLRRCGELLRENGFLFIRTPNAFAQIFRARLKKQVLGMRPEMCYLMARDHPHLYKQSGIRRLLERNGFSAIDFVHLHPIQGVAPRKGNWLGKMKNLGFQVVRVVAVVSGGALNLDNLFVVARKNAMRSTKRHRIGTSCPSGTKQ
jgi:2-polyprenyl-3-methyl-5-hydroxy-6-metoxy-1,4-benzoquinol methylase